MLYIQTTSKGFRKGTVIGCSCSRDLWALVPFAGPKELQISEEVQKKVARKQKVQDAVLKTASEPSTSVSAAKKRRRYFFYFLPENMARNEHECMNQTICQEICLQSRLWQV